MHWVGGMTNGFQKPGAAAVTHAGAWDLVTPRELEFKFPRLTAPIRQLPDLSAEPLPRKLGVVERVFRWLEEQF